MVMSIRLDRATEALLGRLARSRKTTKSQLVRDAIRLLAEQVEGPPRAVKSLRERWKHLIGVVKGGPPDLARRHKEYYIKGLIEKRKGRQ